MKFRLSLTAIALSAVLSPHSAIAQSVPESAAVCTDGYRLNLRQTPNGQILTVLNDGDVVERVAPPAGPWQPVAANGYRGYVWGDYLCDRSAPTPRPPVVGFQPAMCANVDNARNIRHTGGLNVYRNSNPNSEIIGRLNNGSAVLLSGNAIVDASGTIWQPIDAPFGGFIRAGENERVTNLIECTRYYP
ncbi:hypothetical protein AY599_22100 [Leptolyngbya valderiana BDU 20041]|uniref:SH3 domain-containing protein n=1 Tax=Baaleninema simplex TaxID=2862350 RepID=UPI000347E512|nr:SH3 domain-containing protein [Baaleninema simplex]MDC0833723.1 SH3 domain-containing protein [Geitlerinema sp. CS-897]OAB60841.1 hypothetical protein AY599_22100 [Leptolyngbya valderiana BDU 20041]PPT07292.1 hypothetical protein CKA32_003532 [Geitlerinema sp. FC II]